eukprot:7145241-Prymnesium_polylepis.1
MTIHDTVDTRTRVMASHPRPSPPPVATARPSTAPPFHLATARRGHHHDYPPATESCHISVAGRAVGSAAHAGWHKGRRIGCDFGPLPDGRQL